MELSYQNFYLNLQSLSLTDESKRTRESAGRVVLYSMIRDAESGEPGCPKASVPRVKLYAAFIRSERENQEEEDK